MEIYRLKAHCQPSRLGASIARLFGVTPKAIRDIWRRKSWADLTSAPHAEDMNVTVASVDVDRPTKRARRMEEPMPPAQDPTEFEPQTSSRSIPIPKNNLAHPSMEPLAMPSLMPCSRPTRFSTATNPQIDYILLSTQPSIPAAQVHWPSPSYADMAAPRTDGAPTAFRPATSAPGCVERAEAGPRADFAAGGEREEGARAAAPQQVRPLPPLLPISHNR